MLRVIGFLFLLIISQVSHADTIIADSVTNYSMSNSGNPSFSSVSLACESISTSSFSFASPSGGSCLYFIIKNGSVISTQFKAYYPVYKYTCPSGYTQTDGKGNPDSSAPFCTKNSCQDLYQTSTMIPIPVGQTVTNACFDGCSAFLYEGGSWVCPSNSIIECSVRVSFDGNSCSGGVDYAANASSSDSGSGSDSPPPPPPCSAGSTTGTVNGETVTTCADDGTDSPPITDPSGSTSPPTSGAGSTVGSPENTSGTQNSTVGGGTGSLGGSGYGEGGSTGSGGTSGGGTGSGGTSGGDTGSGGTSGGDTGSGGTSGGDTGSGGTSGGDTGSGGTSGGDTGSGGTSGGDTGSGGTSGGDTGSGGTSGGGTGSGGTSGGGTGSGGSSGSGGGSDTGTGTPASGAGDTDSDTPAEEEEESGDGGTSFTEPGEGTDYLKDVFGESDVSSLKAQNEELKKQITHKMSDVKSIFNLGSLAVSGDISENEQEIKGASVDLSGKKLFDQLSILAAVFYLCAIIAAIYIVLGGRK